MSNHRVYVIHFTKRRSIGIWHAEDDYEHKSYSEPEEHKELYVAPNEGVALGYFNYWKQYREAKDNPLEFKQIEDLGKATLLLEF